MSSAGLHDDDGGGYYIQQDIYLIGSVSVIWTLGDTETHNGVSSHTVVSFLAFKGTWEKHQLLHSLSQPSATTDLISVLSLRGWSLSLPDPVLLIH